MKTKNACSTTDILVKPDCRQMKDLIFVELHTELAVLQAEHLSGGIEESCHYHRQHNFQLVRSSNNENMSNILEAKALLWKILKHRSCMNLVQLWCAADVIHSHLNYYVQAVKSEIQAESPTEKNFPSFRVCQ